MCHPGRPAPPRRVPGRAHLLVLRLDRLPEHEVAHVVLVVLVRRHALAAAPGAHVHLRQLAVVRELRDVVVDRAIGHVRQPALLQPADDVDHPLDVVRGAGVHVRPLNPQLLEVAEQVVDERLRVLVQRHAAGQRAADRLVVHVRQVHHEAHFVAAVLQVAVQHVREEERAHVADVRRRVHRRPAGVHPHPAFMQGDELFLAAGERVVEAKGHGISCPGFAVDGRARAPGARAGWPSLSRGRPTSPATPPSSSSGASGAAHSAVRRPEEASAGLLPLAPHLLVGKRDLDSLAVKPHLDAPPELARHVPLLERKRLGRHADGHRGVGEHSRSRAPAPAPPAAASSRRRRTAPRPTSRSTSITRSGSSL